MKLVVSITHMDGVLYATSTGGKCTPQEILYHTQNIVNAAKRHQCDRILIVLNNAASPGIPVNHLLLIAGILGSLPSGTQVAYNRHDVEYHLGSEPSLTTQRFAFFMGAAKAYGVQVRAFESIHDAREWLGLTAMDTTREKQDPQTAPVSQPNALRQARDRRSALLAQAKRVQ